MQRSHLRTQANGSAVIAVTASDAAAAGCNSRQLCCTGSAVHVDRFGNLGVPDHCLSCSTFQCRVYQLISCFVFQVASTFQVFPPNSECVRRVTMRAACPLHPSVLDFITTIMFDEMHIFWSSPLRTSPHTPRNLFFFRTKYSVSILKTLSFSLFFFRGKVEVRLRTGHEGPEWE